MSDILSSHPSRDTFDQPQLRAAIDAASACASTCATCADACLHGDDPGGMARCIDLCNQCASICRAAADVMSRPGPNGDSWEEVVRACIAVCRECADECGSHDMDHCAACAQACRDCADACETLLAVAD
ncbi:four-helix bundle copper-binding protein [Serinicoccus sp. CNJ-927]|uniref:four-helix bundle copper-binding protein n=1 Tax=Serinicoccus TaxID=265976 RepID=UPI0003B45CAC|nr:MULTISPECIES: four-helix bundle copper-binding protein [Serinicoccus]OLT44032.1 four-helix bundle copper-binding protein [Serinicoccus sp. CNJ-927]